MLHITFSGIDKSGKSTLIKSFMEETHYEHYVVDRAPNDYHFFNVIRNRLTGMEELLKYKCFQKRFSKQIDLAILLIVDKNDWLDRCKDHNEPNLVGDLTMKDHQNMLKKYFYEAKYKHTIEINTSKNSIKKCVEMIKENINAN